jgi:type IV pilus assembly protein PilB
MEGVTQVEVNEQIGNSFAKLLRAFLRQDPDNIMVGEIRDADTASIAIRAALTGHTVLSTLHTTDSTSVVARLVDMGVEASLISATLRCVIAQRLVRKLCEKCRCPRPAAPHVMREFALSPESGVELFHGRGCAECHYTGFHGRIPLVELWIPDREELMLINRRCDKQNLRTFIFKRNGRLTLVEDGMRRARQGETTLEEILRVVPSEQIVEVRERSP